MQKHEGPKQPGNDNRPKRSQTWWLMLVIFGLLGLIASQLVQRWLGKPSVDILINHI